MSLLSNVKQKMNILNVNNLGICETRCANTDGFVSDKLRDIYAGGEKM